MRRLKQFTALSKVKPPISGHRVKFNVNISEPDVQCLVLMMIVY